MEKFVRHCGVGVPLRRNNIDTDQILPAEYLKRVSRDGFEDGLFAVWRNDDMFVLNDSRYAGGSILVAGADFGIGSSREHAVWALQDYGFRVVCSSRFGDIFRGNAGKAGLLAAQLSSEDIDALWEVLESGPGSIVSVDLDSRTIAANGQVFSFWVDDYTRQRLLSGLDDVSLSLLKLNRIEDYEKHRQAFLPQILG